MSEDELAKRTRVINLAGAGGCVLAALLAALLGVLPLIRKTVDHREQETLFQGKLNELNDLNKTLGQVETDLTKTQARLAETEQRLPSENSRDKFMSQLAKVADDAGMQVDQVMPKEIHEAGDYKIKPFEIAGQGTYESCYKFLVGLRKMGRLTRLDDAVIQADKELNSSGAVPVCRINVSISTFMTR